jgi:hypothetical protein
VKELPSGAILLAALTAACSQDKSFVVVSVSSSGPPIDNVAQLRVRVTEGTSSEQLLYPETPRPATDLLRLDASAPITFSVSFPTTVTADVTFDVEALDGKQATLAWGTSGAQPLRVGQVMSVKVSVGRICDPTRPAAICDTGNTCALVCDKNSQPWTLCFSAGQGKPGDPCASTADCAAGSECFDFAACSTSAQPVKTCRQFCGNDSDCGTGAFCKTAVSCGQGSTALHLCSRPCDPTGAASGGCATGLTCFIYAGEITDCACRDASRVGSVGVACATDENCQPGLICVDRGGAQTCQAICRLTSPACTAGTTCTRLSNPDYQIYGACLPS